MMKPKAVGKRGFSVLEMLIVCALIGLVTTAVALLFTKGTQIYRHGESHIEMQRAGRHLVTRLSPFVQSMFHSNSPTLSPLVNPDVIGVSRPELVFRTTEDWFAIGYPAAANTSATTATSISDLRNFFYRVRLVNDPTDPNNGNVVLERLNCDSTTGTLTPNTASVSGATGLVTPVTVTAPAIDNTRILLRLPTGQTVPTCSAFPCPDLPADPHAKHFQFVQPNVVIGSDAIRLQFTTRTTTQGETVGAPPIVIDEDFRVTFVLPQNKNS
jgi:prepilin-type N-terminal cleavage/methylation domain-containing protein